MCRRVVFGWALCLGLAISSLGGPGGHARAWPVSRALGDPAAAPAEAAAAKQDSLIPVVLVHGLRGSGPSSWGEPEASGQPAAGVYLRLCQAGYEPGRTLFVCDFREDNLGDYRDIAHRDLPAAIDLAKALSGSDRVDLVARSMGGLVARCYVTSPAYRGDVRTLVMIATPNRGSFAANIVKSAEMIHLQEQLRQRGTAHRSPLDRPVLPPDMQLVGEWRDEVSYVARQSQEIWEPLFGHYYATAYLLAEPAAPGGGSWEPPGFWAWLEAAYPAVSKVLLAEAQRPPVSPSYMRGGAGGFAGGGAPGAGESLSRAYYELLAVQCARHNFLLGRQLKAPEVRHDAKPGTWLEKTIAWLTRLVADKIGAIARRQGQGLGIWAMEHLAGLDPKARAADCLIEETTSRSLGGPMLLAAPGATSGRVALPGGAEPADRKLVANYYLARWNRHDAARREAAQQPAVSTTGLPPGVRYVHIAGQVPNVWSGLWSDVGPNDLIVETSSTWLPLADDDAYHLFPSLVGTNHVWIGAGGKPWQALIGALRDYYPLRSSYSPPYRPGKSKLALYTRRGKTTAEVYQPCYLELKLPAAGTATVKLSYRWEGLSLAGATSSAAGGLRAWAYLDLPGHGLSRYPLAFVVASNGEMVAELAVSVPDVPGARMLVGVRAEEGEVGDACPPPNRKLAFQWDLGYDPRGGGAEPVAPAEVTLTVGAGDGPPAPGQPHGAPPSVGQGQPAHRQVPLIQATHRDKQTIYVEPAVLRHDRWEWAFGDGTTRVDRTAGPTQGEVSHVYRSPGSYLCVARSLTADGQELARYEWEVAVEPAQAPLERAFRASTLQAPEVDLRLDGPLAWVTGRPADYRLTYELRPTAGANAVAEVAHLFPGAEFQMLWHKPGTFVVAGALTLRLVYEDGAGRRSVTNVYTVEQEVRVYATVVTE